MTARQQIVAERLKELSDSFPDYVRAYDVSIPFSNAQFQTHKATLKRRRELGSAVLAVQDSDFMQLALRTLRAWRLDTRGSRLAPLDEISSSLMSQRDVLGQLDGQQLEDPNLAVDETAQSLWSLIESSRITDNKAKLVASCKLLHHILPDLVPPVDRAYTGAFFGWPGSYFQYRQREIFFESFLGFAALASATKPSSYVGEGWRTSASKIIDNSIIAYCRLRSSIPSDPEPIPISGEDSGEGPYDLARLAASLREANRVNARIAEVIDRPVLPGHIGEYIASHIFDVKLESSAVQAGYDGVYRSGPFSGATVNIKLYGSLDYVLDIGLHRPDYYLVMTGSKGGLGTSRGGSRPWGIEKVFIFRADFLVSALEERGVKIGIATSVRKEHWDGGQIYPIISGAPWVLSKDQIQQLELFSPELLV